MDMDVTEQIKSLIYRAQQADKSDDALKFSQAACNAANAMACVRYLDEPPIDNRTATGAKLPAQR